MTFLTILGVTEILCSFRLVLERKTFEEIPKSSRLEFLENFLGNNFALPDAENKTSGLVNRGGIADLRFWEVMDSFILLAYATSAASRTLLQRLLAYLNFNLDLKDLFCWYKQKK